MISPSAGSWRRSTARSSARPPPTTARPSRTPAPPCGGSASRQEHLRLLLVRHASGSTFMSDTSSATPQRDAGYPEIFVNPLVLHRSRLPFTISLAAFVALLILIFSPTLYSLATGKPALM